jgi:hypothetical protein
VVESPAEVVELLAGVPAVPDPGEVALELAGPCGIQLSCGLRRRDRGHRGGDRIGR